MLGSNCPNWAKNIAKPPKLNILHPIPIFRNWAQNESSMWESEWANAYFKSEALVKTYPEHEYYRYYNTSLKKIVKKLNIFSAK